MMADSSPLPNFVRRRSESGTSDGTYHFVCLEYIPDEFKALAGKELDETEEKTRRGLERLRKLLKREKKPSLEDYLLTAVLRSCKYDEKKSETKLKKFLKVRRIIFEKITELDLKKVELIMEDKGIGVLPYRDKYGRAIVFTRPQVMNNDLYSMDEVMVTIMACAMVILKFPLTAVGGIAYLGDCRYKSVSSQFAILKAFHRHMPTLLDMPFRIGRIDLIYEHFITRWFVGIVRPFLSSKILNRITFFGSNLDSLQKEYHPDILPEEFGGRMGPLDPSFYKDMVLDTIRQLQAEARAPKEAVQ